MGGPRISQHIRRDPVHIRGAAKAKLPFKLGPLGGSTAAAAAAPSA